MLNSYRPSCSLLNDVCVGRRDDIEMRAFIVFTSIKEIHRLIVIERRYCAVLNFTAIVVTQDPAPRYAV